VAEGSHVTLALDVPDVEVWARAVPGAAEQVLDNLIDNALCASPPGATVTLIVEAGLDEHRLTVADEGPGLDDGQKARALDRFWRGRSAQPGTGLGLAIVAALSSASGGSVALSDRAPAGLAVTVTLPAAPGARPTP
jgi:signal transduction histidine kinase